MAPTARGLSEIDHQLADAGNYGAPAAGSAVRHYSVLRSNCSIALTASDADIGKVIGAFYEFEKYVATRLHTVNLFFAQKFLSILLVPDILTAHERRTATECVRVAVELFDEF